MKKVAIDVVNTWVNEMMDDSKFPEPEIQTWINVNTFNAESLYE